MGKKVLITGGVRSGKSAYALELAREYPPPRLFLAAAEAADPEMKARIQRHQKERGSDFVTLERPINLIEALQGPESKRSSVVLVDCLTLWLNNLFHYFSKSASQNCSSPNASLSSPIAFPPELRRIRPPAEIGDPFGPVPEILNRGLTIRDFGNDSFVRRPKSGSGNKKRCRELVAFLSESEQDVILVTNEIGLGLMPNSSRARIFLDELGFLNQEVARISDEVVLMICGLPSTIKGVTSERRLDQPLPTH